MHMQCLLNLLNTILQVMTPSSERRNSTAMYNPMMISELKENYPNFNWGSYFETVFTDTDVTIGDDERVIVVQPDYFEASGNIEASTEVVGKEFINTKYFLTNHSKLTMFSGEE